MTFLFFLAIGIAIFLGPAYLFWLSCVRSQQSPPVKEPKIWPRVDVILPLHNEKEWIGAKLENLRQIVYAAGRLTIWIVDGASSDGTAEIVQKEIEGDNRFRLLRLDISNKTAQLNEALKGVTGEWIMVTDADAQLSPQTLQQMITMGESDERLAVIGTAVRPYRAHPLEQLHWNFFTRLWKLESGRGFASLVTAP